MPNELSNNAKLGIAAMGGITVLAVAAFAVGTVLPPTRYSLSPNRLVNTAPAEPMTSTPGWS